MSIHVRCCAAFVLGAAIAVGCGSDEVAPPEAPAAAESGVANDAASDGDASSDVEAPNDGDSSSDVDASSDVEASSDRGGGVDASLDVSSQDSGDAGAEDASDDTRDSAPADAPGDAAAGGLARTRYPVAAHSPMTAHVVNGLMAVLDSAGRNRTVFAKIGDSITVAPQFLGCFASADVDWGAYAALEPTRALFGQAVVDGTHCFDRVSLAAKVGWTASAPLAGNPAPLVQEVGAINPAFGVIMLGTNDTLPTRVHTFEHDLLADVDAMLSRGVVPLMSTIPPRGDSADANLLVPEMNAVIRAIAQARQVPLMDLWSALIGLPSYGLAGDGLHPQAYAADGGGHGCWFSPAALGAGMNQRNLITMQALDRARRFLIDRQAAEPAPPDLEGQGSVDDPWVVPALPFVDDADSALGAFKLSGYGCGPADGGGPELVYRIQVDAGPKKIRARVFCDDGVDVDLYWMNGASAAACVVGADQTLDVTATAGTYLLAIDSRQASEKALSGKYRLTVVEIP